MLRKFLDILLYAAPVAIPSVMMMTGQIGHARLARDKISLKFPEALEIGGLSDVVCFDKTGTLTHSVVSCRGVLCCVKPVIPCKEAVSPMQICCISTSPWYILHQIVLPYL